MKYKTLKDPDFKISKVMPSPLKSPRKHGIHTYES